MSLPPFWACLHIQERNSNYGKRYLQSIGLDSEKWSADLVAFWRNNPDLDVEVKRLNQNLRSSETRGVITFKYEGETYFIIDCGLIRKQNEDTMFRSLKNSSMTICQDAHYPIKVPESSCLPINVGIKHLTNEAKMVTPETDFFKLADVYCFDLDQTLTSRHITGFSREKINSLYDLILFPNELRALFEELIKIGKNIYIATFSDSLMYGENKLGGVELVSIILQLLLPINWNKIRIIAWYPPLYGQPSNKNIHLKIAADEMDVPPEKVILIDDDSRNIYAASFIGYQTLHVPNGLFA